MLIDKLIETIAREEGGTLTGNTSRRRRRSVLRKTSTPTLYGAEGLERRVLLSSAIAAFGVQQTFAVGARPYATIVADVNGDGKADLLSVNKAGNPGRRLAGEAQSGQFRLPKLVGELCPCAVRDWTYERVPLDFGPGVRPLQPLAHPPLTTLRPIRHPAGAGGRLIGVGPAERWSTPLAAHIAIRTRRKDDSDA